MPSRLTNLLLPLLLLGNCTSESAAQGRSAPPEPAREFRGAWVATVNNIDFPSRPGLAKAQLQQELDAMVERAQQLRLNALLFQVRPAADAFYRSSLEPWSEWLSGAEGRAPDGDFDPLAYLIAAAHARGIQLHAWFNPFRARHKDAKTPHAASHVALKAPRLVHTYGQYEWMDPGEPLAQKWSLAVIQDVVRNYDVDGVHIDDYFYPYPEGKKEFPDAAAYAAYTRGGGKLGRSDWRRHNVDTFVQRMYAVVHEEKPWVAVGISPFGIARPGVPKGVTPGFDQYEQLYADAEKWLRQGWLDYLSPQLYWPIDGPQPFPLLLEWWHAQNPKGRAVWPGLNAGRALGGGKHVRPDELSQQIALVRRADKAPGCVLYSFKALRTDADAVGGALRQRVNREPALAPALHWLPGERPASPSLKRDGATLAWAAQPNVRFLALLGREGGAWRTLAIVDGQAGRCELPAGVSDVIAVDRRGVSSAAVRL